VVIATLVATKPDVGFVRVVDGDPLRDEVFGRLHGTRADTEVSAHVFPTANSVGPILESAFLCRVAQVTGTSFRHKQRIVDVLWTPSTVGEVGPSFVPCWVASTVPRWSEQGGW